MKINFDDLTTLNADTSADDRGLNLVRVFVSKHSLGGRKFGRINTEGGLTYVMPRSVDLSRNSVPTLVLSRDEAQIIMTSLGSYLYGQDWYSSPAEVKDMRAKFAAIAEENSKMRAQKKLVEEELKVTRQAVDQLQAAKRRYDDVMAVVAAVNAKPKAAEHLRDCCE